MQQLRICYLGNYRHHHCTEVHVARELEALGCHVDRVQEPPGGGDEGFLRTLYARAVGGRADLLLWTRTWGLPEKASGLWRRLERAGVQTASLHLDLYVGLKREAGLDADPFWRTGTVITPDGDPYSAGVFKAHGIHHVYSPPAVVSDECTPGTFKPRLAYDVVFVGSGGRSYHEEWPHRGRLLEHLQDRYAHNFARFGSGARVMRDQDLNDLYASARVVVGDSLALAGHVNYWSDRPYETVGRGGFLLMTRVPGLEQHFTDGEHLRFWGAGEFDQLDELIDRYLADPDERLRISTSGQAHVRAHHTYQHRLAVILERLGVTGHEAALAPASPW